MRLVVASLALALCLPRLGLAASLPPTADFAARRELVVMPDGTGPLVLEPRTITRRGPDSLAWRGGVVGDATSSATFVIEGERVTGVVRTEGRAWIARRDAAGVERWEEADLSNAIEGDDAVLMPEPPPRTAALPDAPTPSADDGSVIDIMVVYTARALAREPDIEAMIDLAVEDTNAAFERSFVSTRLRLVHVQQVAYVESGSTLSDLYRMQDPDDGFMDDVPELQNACAADLVSLWISEAWDAGGRGVLTRLAPAPHPYRDSTHDVVVVWMAVAGMAFAHEVGHNIGCMHDRANSSFPGAFSYSYGYMEPQCRWRTIMSYGGCTRIASYSNPDVLERNRPTGVPIGEPDEANNAVSLNGVAPTVAGFHQSTTGCCVGDGHEPDDSFAAARSLRPGEVSAHDFCDDSQDWHIFPVALGREYVIETFALEPSTDTILELYRDDGTTRLAVNDNASAGERASRLAWTATFSGDVRLLARQSAAGGAGPGRSYSLRLIGDISPPEPSADALPVPLLVRKDATGAAIVSVELVPTATSLVAFEGRLSDPSMPTSRTCVTTWSVDGASVVIGGRLAGDAQWIAIASANANGESSAGRDSRGEEPRESGGGWPTAPSCP